MTERRRSERGERPGDERRIRLDRLPLPVHRHACIRATRELERVHLAHRGLVPPRHERARERELRDQAGQLLRRLVDHPREARLALGERAAAHHRLREAADRRERRAQVVAREPHHLGEALLAHVRTKQPAGAG